MKTIIIIILMAVALGINAFALETCRSIGYQCSIGEFCIGKEQLTISVNGNAEPCCIGRCEKYQALYCENSTSENLKCHFSTSKEVISNYKYNSMPFFIKFLNAMPPSKPYPKLSDFITELVIIFWALILIMNAVSYFKAISFESPEALDRIKNRFMLSLLIGIILPFAQQIAVFLFTTVDSALTIAVRLFVPNGDLLNTINFLLQTPGNSLFYLLRDILYFLFLIVLLIRYVAIYILLIFISLFIGFYLVYATKQIGGIYLRALFANITIPILWVISFSALAFAVKEIANAYSIHNLLPILLAGVIYLNILLYRKYTSYKFSFWSIFKKIYGARKYIR